jgi:glyoxylase-like metal-dependent hydrolase (beta-lactamase superfamily II)
MKRPIVLGTVVVSGLVAMTLFGQAGQLGIDNVAMNLYRVTGQGGNTAVFVRNDGVLLVDTKLANNGEQIMKQVRSVTDKPVTMLINTHVHGDHNGSNDYFTAARPNVQVVTHENTRKWVTANPKANRATIPTTTFDNVASLGSGRDRIDLYWFGAGHTDGDAFVVFPALRAMCIGDLMAWNMAPLIDPQTKGSVIALPDTLEKALKGIRNVDLVIEGHGNVNTWAGFRAYTEFNRALLTVAQRSLKRGETPEQALAELEKNKKLAVFMKEELLPGLEYGNTPKARALININVAYQELKGEPVTTNFGPRAGGPGRGAPPAEPPAK